MAAQDTVPEQDWVGLGALCCIFPVNNNWISLPGAPGMVPELGTVPAFWEPQALPEPSQHLFPPLPAQEAKEMLARTPRAPGGAQPFPELLQGWERGAQIKSAGTSQNIPPN